MATTSRLVTRRLALAGSTAALVATLAACSGKNEPVKADSKAPATPASGAPSPSTTMPTPATSPTEGETEAAGVPWTTGSSSSQETGTAGVETAFRSGIHNGYDRVVVELSGASGLGWQADFVDAAYTQGKGDVIDLKGSHILRVIGRGSEMPGSEADAKMAYNGPYLLNVGGTAIKQAYLDPTFEAQFQLVLGVENTEYRVFTLTEPARLVVDVRQP